MRANPQAIVRESRQAGRRESLEQGREERRRERARGLKGSSVAVAGSAQSEQKFSNRRNIEDRAPATWEECRGGAVGG